MLSARTMPATSARAVDEQGCWPIARPNSASGCCTMAKGKTKNNRAAKKSSWQKPKRENVVGPDNADEKAELLEDAPKTRYGAQVLARDSAAAKVKQWTHFLKTMSRKFSTMLCQRHGKRKWWNKDTTT